MIEKKGKLMKISALNGISPKQQNSNTKLSFEGIWKKGTDSNSDPYTEITAVLHTYYPDKNESDEQIREELKKKAPQLLYSFDHGYRTIHYRGDVNTHFALKERTDSPFSPEEYSELNN